ncbi:MAG: hypothetical protein ABI234_13565 [Ktedonobacteraceae bacterium]
MKPETEALLRQCRASLLRQSDQHVAALLAYWFETMIGEEHMEEDIDDLCLMLDYRVQTYGSQTIYGTYTSWWEVEGYLEPGEGIFTCANVPSLRLRLLDMSPKEFDLVVELAYQVRSLLNQMDGRSQPPTGHPGLREMSIWMQQTILPTKRSAPEPEPVTSVPLPQPVTAESKEQRRKRDKEIARLASQLGYLVVSRDTSSWVKDTFRHACKINSRPYIWIELMEAERARLHADSKTLKRGADVPTPHIQEQLAALVASYITRAQAQHYQARFYWPTQQVAVLDEILVEDAEQAAQEVLALWSKLLKDLPPSVVKPITRYTSPTPAWKCAIDHLKASVQPLPLLPDTVVLPEQWENLLTREHLVAFLRFLGLPARTRDTKAPLVQRLQERMDTDATVKAQLFEVFVHELIVPPWELETLLVCTPTERKRWTEEGKLSVFSHDSFRKGGTQRNYSLFDRRVVLSISPTQIEEWRAEHQALVKARRSASARTAAATRKANQLDLAQQTAER